MGSNRGFTVVDVLAAGAVGCVAVALAQPVLKENKAQSMNITNRSQHQLLAARQGMFMLANDGQFTGANVTGWVDVPGPNQSDAHYVGNTTAGTPTQTTDWITPLIGEEFEFSANRAERTQQMFEQMHDPRNGRFIDAVYGSAAIDDLADFAAVMTNDGIRSTSYLAPAAFQYWGTPLPGGFVPGQGLVKGDEYFWNLKYGGVPYNWSIPMAGNIKTPREYRPRIANVGASTSQKVMFADGTRYVDFSGSIDIDIDPTPSFSGNFLSSFFAYEGEVAYGRDWPGLPFSARRQGLGQDLDSRVLFITFYDGSTRSTTVAQAKARPDWWAPTGSEWVSFNNIAPEASDGYEVGDLLP